MFNFSHVIKLDLRYEARDTTSKYMPQSGSKNFGACPHTIAVETTSLRGRV